ncbi:MAG: HlyD family efflux transporter periplasmic adaptor subunit [Burkholderiales bacterium]|jgi:membrane fusion protein|nr:MAG: HlyD family efflux transporter periplasmic adaptor subunit [Burkholderiales bacterium]
MRKLFRQEAIDAQREKLLGEVSTARPVPTWVFTLLALSFAALIIGFMFWGEYTRRERVAGFLVPDVGAAPILAPEAGTLAELMVKEGDPVDAGAPIARLSLERGTASGATSADLMQRELKQRVANLEAEKENVRLLAEQQKEQLRRRIDDLKKELAQADTEIRLQSTRVASAREDFQRTQQLVKDGFVSDTALAAKRNEQLDQQVKLETLRRSRAAIARDLRSAQSDLPAIDLRARQQTDQLTREGGELQQDLVQQEARRETVIRAPIAGTVTNIAVARGQSLAADAPLATVLPAGSGLEAQLLVPTRAAGFVQPGNAVVLRYEAFPFQRFGQYRGVVHNVSRTVWSPGEKVGPMTVREPVYRIDVELERQTVAVSGQEVPLRPGMLVSADILLEKRTVFEWIFEPVLELRGRLQ